MDIHHMFISIHGRRSSAFSHELEKKK
jgi:hypothetical protein